MCIRDRGTSCVLCLIHLLKKGEVYTVTPRNIRFHASMLSEIIRYGLPSGVPVSYTHLDVYKRQVMIFSMG